MPSYFDVVMEIRINVYKQTSRGINTQRKRQSQYKVALYVKSAEGLCMSRIIIVVLILP